MSDTALPLILTLKLDPQTFSTFDRLRQQHFPPERNFLPAHITLFHALPGAQLESIQQFLQAECAHQSVLSLTFPQVRFLGRGVAIEVHCPALVQLRQRCATHWQAWLTPQDQQGYRPHITIQNKTTAERSRHLYEQLAPDWQALTGTGEGLLLWYYKGGPWELVSQFDFLENAECEVLSANSTEF